MASRLIAVVLLVALSTGCATPHGVRLDTGQGTPLEYRPSTSNLPVSVDAEAFEEALSRMVLEMPLALRPPQQGWLIRASYPSNDADARWQRLMSKAVGGLCKPGQRRAVYSSVRLNLTGSSSLTVRQWLSTQSYEAQRTFGLRAIENVTKGFW